MFQTMESISVLVANMYGIMVPINGSYHDLINLSSLELDINNDIDELEEITMWVGIWHRLGS